MGQNAGVGSELAYGAAAMSERIRQMVMDRLVQAQAQQEMKLRDADMNLRERQFQSNEELKRAQLASMQEQRDVTAGNQVSQDLEPGDVLQPDQSQVLRRAHMGSNIVHQGATLPSTQTQGAVRMPQILGRVIQPSGATSPEQGQASQGAATQIEQPGNPEQDVYRGTGAQRTAQEQKTMLRGMIRTMPNSPAAQWMGLKAATGLSVPEALIAPKPTGEEDQRKFLTIQQKQRMGQPLTPEETAFAGAYKETKTLGPTASFNLNQGQRDDARLDRSYNARSTELTNLRKPLADQADKLNGLAEVVGQGTPEADALVAPKLLSSIVGGQGSGLRMNQAEIDRVVGGRSVWENLKAAAQHWSTDPKTANSITPEQRQQIRALMEAYQRHVGDRLKLVDDANDQLIDAGDVESHRRIISDVRKKLDALSVSSSNQAGPPTPHGAITVTYGGRTYSFPNQAAADNFKREAGIR